MSERASRYAAALLFASIGACARPGGATADVGEPAPLAFSAVTGRTLWARITPRIVDSQNGSTVRVATWERDASSEEKRYVIRERVASTDDGGSSLEESYERSTLERNYVRSPSALGDLASAVSFPTLRDFEHAKTGATVPSEASQVVQTFFRGKRWAYSISTSNPTPGRMRNVSWTQFPLADLAQRVKTAKACAATGECGE